MKNANDALDSMARAVNANSRAVSLLGARAIVLSKFLEAILPQLTAAQRTAAIMPFRCGVENAMSHMDDVVCQPNSIRHCLISPIPYLLGWGSDYSGKKARDNKSWATIKR